MTFTDPRDGKVYRTVKIGEQTWMAENLNYECRGSRYKEKHGRLYTYNAAKKACPPGWHLPSLDEWEELFYFCDFSMRREKEWEINDYGFATLPGGIGCWWYAESGGHWSYESNNLRWIEKNYPNDYIILGSSKFKDRTYRSFSLPKKGSLFSVRCLKGEANNNNNKKIAIKNAKALKKGSFTDPRDGKVYKIVKIGKQIWMAENLNYECEESLCYSKDPANAEKYGRYYNWKTAINVCPPGWHLPSYAEWEEFIESNGGEEIDELLKAKTGWLKPGNGYDVYEFAALPGGFGNQFGFFRHAGNEGSWWSASEIDANKAHLLRISEGAGLEPNQKFNYHNIRCIKDGCEASFWRKWRDKTSTEELNSEENTLAFMDYFVKEFERNPWWDGLPPSPLIEIPEIFRTAKVYLAAVKKDGFALIEVPEELKTEELCIEAVKRCGWVLEFVPKAIREKVKDAVDVFLSLNK